MTAHRHRSFRPARQTTLQVPQELFAGWFPGAKDVAEMLAYFEAHTYLGADSREAIALANRIAGREPTKFAAWVRANFAIPAAA